MAEELVLWLQRRGDLQREALRQTGRPTDRDAWLWPGTTPDYVARLDEACDELGPRPDGSLSVVRADRSACGVWLGARDGG